MEKLLTFYQEIYGGTKIPRAEQPHLLRRGGSWVDLFCIPSPKQRQKQEQTLLYAACAVADALYEQQKTVSKEKNGELELDYALPPAVSERKAATQAMLPYLAGSGLLYCGVSRW